MKGCVRMKKSRLGVIAVLLVMTLVTTGCSLTGSKWAAKVNGEEILVSTVNSFAENAQKIYEGMGLDFSTDEGKTMLKQLKAQILERQIESKLIEQEIASLGLTADDPKVKEQEEIVMTSFGNNEDYLNQTLALQGMDKQALTNFLVLYVKVTEGINVTDDEVTKFFEENKDSYGTPEQVKASHILVATEEEAQGIIKELDNGANFAELAKTKSTEDGADQSGGSLGYFSKGDMVEAFEQAAFAQKVGTWSKTPVKTDFGYHVILVEDHKAAVEAKFEEIKDTVKADALVKAQDNKYTEYMEALTDKSKIEYASGYKPEDK